MAEYGKITLHAFSASSCSWRVRLALSYKGIPYEYKKWNLSKGEHLSEAFVYSGSERVGLPFTVKDVTRFRIEHHPASKSLSPMSNELPVSLAEFKKISPGQTVPSLEIDGAVLTDSVAILEFLEERFPDKPLLPKDLGKRAAIRSFVNMIASGIQPIQNLRVLKSIAAMAGEQARIEWAQKWITSGFEALEVIVKETAREYCFGDEFTLADVTLIPQLGNAYRFNVDMTKFPTLQQIERNLYQLELVKNSTPEHTPDFQTS